MGIISIIELPPFSKKAPNILTKKELDKLYDYIKLNPEKGNIIPGTGGIRKLRWSSDNKGKRGGSRIIYFYSIVGSTIYLITCYTKNDQSDLSNDAKKKYKTLIEQIKKEIRNV